jgi:hypothetical protein
MCTTVVSSSILTAWPVADAARVVAFFLAASGFVTGITWVNKHPSPVKLNNQLMASGPGPMESMLETLKSVPLLFRV